MEPLKELSYYSNSSTKYTDEESFKIENDYNSNCYDIFKIANKYKRTPGCIAYKLKSLKIINHVFQARGYSDYVESDLYKEILSAPKEKNNIRTSKTKEIYNEVNAVKDEIKVMKRDISEIKQNIDKILTMITAIYDFESEQSQSSENDENLYVDGSCNEDTKGFGWGSVVSKQNFRFIDNNLDLLKDMNIQEVKTPKGRCNVIVCRFGDVNSQQNNGAELMAMVAGLRIALKYNYKKLFSDSSLMTDYWSLGKISNSTKLKMDSIKLKYIQECTDLRKQFESKGGVVLKISGDKNPADLGYHK